MRYENARIDKDYLKAHAPDFDRYFYVCGPEKMVKELLTTLRELGAAAEKVVTGDLDS